MKKVILSFAVIAGLGTLTSVNASNISNDEANVITVWQDNGFVDVTLDSLNEKVQASINAILQEYELNSLQYNAEKQITKLEATHKSDKSVKVFYFDAEGKELFRHEGYFGKEDILQTWRKHGIAVSTK